MNAQHKQMGKSSLNFLTILLVALFLITACQQTPTIQPPPDKSVTVFDATQFTGGKIYSIIPGESAMDIFVYRAGALAGLGHNHIVSAHNIHGNIYRHTELAKSGVIMQLAADEFEIDNAEKRRLAGSDFSSIPNAKDIAGTRSNMLGPKILNASEFPEITIKSIKIKAPANNPNITLRATVKNQHYDFTLPITVKYQEDRVTIEGKTRLLQTDLGLEPFSILMGAIAIQNEIDIQCHIVAKLSPTP